MIQTLCKMKCMVFVKIVLKMVVGFCVVSKAGEPGAKKSISPAFTDNMDFILQSVFYFVTMQSQHFLRPVQSVPYWNDVCQLIVATISPSIPLFATIVAKAAVGPAICTLEPPRNDTRNPAIIAV